MIAISRHLAISLAVTWFPQAVTAQAPQLADSKRLPSGALAYIAETPGNRVARVIEERAALPADTETADTLDVSPGSPVLVTRSRHYGTTGQLVAYSESTLTAGNWRSFSYTVAGAT